MATADLLIGDTEFTAAANRAVSLLAAALSQEESDRSVSRQAAERVVGAAATILPSLARWESEEPGELATWLRGLRERVAERVAQRNELGGRLRQARSGHELAGKADALELERQSGEVETCLRRWDLTAAEAALVSLATWAAERHAAAAAARAELERVRATLAGFADAPEAPVGAGPEEILEWCRRGERWNAERQEREARERAEREARERAEREARERAEREAAPAPGAPDRSSPPDPRPVPQLLQDHFVAALLQDSSIDAIDALTDPRVSRVVLGERVRALVDLGRQREVAEVMDACRDPVSGELDENGPDLAAFLALLGDGALSRQALDAYTPRLAREQGPVIAFVAATGLHGEQASPDLLDRLYLDYAGRGAAGRAQLLEFVNGWEEAGEPPPHQDRAWVFALARIEAATARRRDPDALSRAQTYAAALPDCPLKMLLLAALDEGVPDDELDSTESIAAEIRRNIAHARARRDYWNNNVLFRNEGAELDRVEKELATVLGFKDWRELDAYQVKPTKERDVWRDLKSLASQSKNKDPTGNGGRMQNYVLEFTERTNLLQRLARVRVSELRHPGQARQARVQVAASLPAYTPCQRVVAEVILAGGASPPKPGPHLDARGWDAEWFERFDLLRELGLPTSAAERSTLARRVIEETVVARAQDEAVRAWFGAMRGDLWTVQHSGPSEFLGFCQQLAEWRADRELEPLRERLRTLRDLSAQATSLGVTLVDVSASLAQLERAFERRAPHAISLPKLDQHISEALLPLIEAEDTHRDEIQRLQQGLAQVTGQRPAGRPGTPPQHLEAAELLPIRRWLEGALAAAAGGAQAPREAVAGTQDASDQAAIVSRLRSQLEQLRLAVNSLRERYFDVSAADTLLAAMDRDGEAALTDARLRQVEAAVSSAARLDETPRMRQRMGTLTAGEPSQQRMTELAQAWRRATQEAGGRGAQAALEAAAELLAGARRDSARGRAYAAELARWTAWLAAERGDGEAAYSAVEDYFFQVQRHGATWARERESQMPTPPGPEPERGVVLLLQVALVLAAPPPRRKAVFEWLTETASLGKQLDSVKAALQPGAELRLASYLFHCLRFVPNLDAVALFRALQRLWTLAETPTSLTASVVGSLHTVSARQALGSLLGRGARTPEDWDWALSLLDQAVTAPRREGENDRAALWAGISRELRAYGRATGGARQRLQQRLTTSLIRAGRSLPGELPMGDVVAGLRDAMIEGVDAEDTAVLTVELEEQCGTVTGNNVVFTLALKNLSEQVIHDVRITAQSGSEVQPPAAGDRTVDGEELFLAPGQTEILRLAWRLQAPPSAVTAALALDVHYRGTGSVVAERRLNCALSLRAGTSIPALSRDVLFPLFSDDGHEVVKQEESFFGRVSELEELDARIFGRNPEAVYLHGMRRIGKTSLARVFMETATGRHDALASFLDFRRYSGAPGDGGSPVSPWRTFAFLARGALQTPTDSGTLGARLGLSGFGWVETLMRQFRDALDPASLLLDVLTQAADLEPNRCILIVIDELDYLVDPWNRGGSTRQDVYDFFNVLRGLLHAHEGSLGRYRWILSGSDRCDDMMSEHGNPLYGSVAGLRVHLMKRPEAEALFTQPFSRLPEPGIQVSREAVNEVFNLTAGFPFFIQIVGKQICRLLAVEPAEVISRWHVRKAVEASLPSPNNPSSHAAYDRIFEPIRAESEKALLFWLLALVARRTTDEEARVSIDEVLVPLAEGSKGSIDRLRALKAADLLHGYNLLMIDARDERHDVAIPFPLVRRLLQAKSSYAPALLREEFLLGTRDAPPA